MTREELIKKIQHLEDLNSKMMEPNIFMRLVPLVKLFKGANNAIHGGEVNKMYEEVMNDLNSMESQLNGMDFYGLTRRVISCKPK